MKKGGENRPFVREFDLGSALNKKLYGPVIGFLFFFREITGWNLTSLTMIMQTFATNAMLVTRVCAGAILLIDSRSWTLIFLLH